MSEKFDTFDDSIEDLENRKKWKVHYNLTEKAKIIIDNTGMDNQEAILFASMLDTMGFARLDEVRKAVEIIAKGKDRK